MKKILIKLFLLAVFLCASVPVYADSVITQNGNVIKGRVNYVMENIVEIKAKNDTKKIYRPYNHEVYTDIVETGFISRSKIAGHVNYVDDDYVDIATSSGNMRINRFKVRNIVISE